MRFTSSGLSGTGFGIKRFVGAEFVGTGFSGTRHSGKNENMYKLEGRRFK